MAVALALISSLCWGVSDFLGGVQARRLPLIALMLLSQGAALVCLLVALAVSGTPPPPLVRLLPAAGAGVGGTVALTAFYRALAIGKMSIVAPVSATGVAVPVLVGVASGNRPAALQAVGIAAAVLGVVLASRESELPPPDSARPAAVRKQLRTAGAGVSGARASIALALVAALGFGGFFVGMRASAQHGVTWALSTARISSVAVLALAARARRERVRLPGRTPAALAPLLAVGLLDLAANALYAVATRRGQLAIVAVVASLYPVATVLLARGLLRERVQRVQELGIASAIAGVMLIAAG